ncbi:hypothetical protein [Dyadobacter chenhuakuii]|uniref:Uncharacterized protein n=1 Tax=Dyadobacter chenhuakuii TaxID=2909339 RepID=A0ABY4XQ20_9BACT|nr:hypothetical protein [Dyadobacter chenhuakuii]MCF2494454.1 hypothetical protein [Dyadobacter chenhuakuii]USJ32220.1 hypothetical protein NFI80_05640 [Dyadobacter chenhuakuii]
MENESHSMDAAVKNRAEAEIIRIFKETAKILELDIDLEVAALEPGGIKEIFRFVRKKKNAKISSAIQGFLAAIISGIIVDLAVSGLRSNSHIEELTVKKTELEIRKLQKEIELMEDSPEEINSRIDDIVVLISQTDKIRRYKSNFYSSLLIENKVTKIGAVVLDSNYREIFPELLVTRSDFNKYLVDQIVLAPLIYKDVYVEIVSPVLKTGKIKWKGIYDSETINFNLHDAEFRQSVINREVSFANGSVIRCDIEFERQMDQHGEVKVTSVNVSNIIELIQGGLIIETKKGKHRKAAKSQLGLFE